MAGALRAAIRIGIADVKSDMRKSFVALMLLVACTAGATELVVNGGFEQNGGIGTNVFAGWTHSDTTSGSWYVQQGVAATPLLICSEILVPRPPSGFAAMINGPEKGTRLLYQDVAIPPGMKATLSFDVAFSTTNSFNPAPAIDENVLNQQFRADLMDPGAPLRDVGSGVLMKLYQTQTSDPKTTQYTKVTRDVSAFAGRTVRLRFAEVDRQFCLLAGIDNVSIDVTPLATIDELSATKSSVSWHFSGAQSASLFDVTSGIPQLLANVGPTGSMNATGTVYSLAVDGGPTATVVVRDAMSAVATIARDLKNATAIAIDPRTNEPVVADLGVPSIIRVEPRGVVTRIASQPGSGVAVDAAGNIYIADSIDQEIRRVAPDGSMSVVAGNQGNPASDDGNGIQARFDAPGALAFDVTGDLVVADTNNHSLRRVTPQGGVTTIVHLDFAPRGVAVATDGTIYVSSDNDVRNAITGAIVRTTGGPIAVDTAGNLHTIEQGAVGERLDHPSAIAIASDGRIFIADGTAVRVLVPAAAPSTPVHRRRAV